MKQLMNLLTLVILLGGGYFVYQRYSQLKTEAEEKSALAAQNAAAAATQAAASTPAPAQPAPNTATAPATATNQLPAAAQPSAPAVASSSTNMPSSPATETAVAAATNMSVASTTEAAVASSTTNLPAAGEPPSALPTVASTVVVTPPAPLQQNVVQPVVIGGMGGARPGERVKSIREWQPADYVAGLPQNAIIAYVQARSSSGTIALRSWMTMWLNRLPDPQRALVEIDYAKTILNSSGGFVSVQDEAAAKQQNARTAKTILQSVRNRGIVDMEVIEFLSQAEREADARMTTFR